MLKFSLKQILKGLWSRYKFTYRYDMQNLFKELSYYTDVRRWIEVLYIYNIFEIMFFLLRFFFKSVFWWPVLWPYIMFCYIVRYVFIPWHYFFLDLILPSLEQALGGAKQVKNSYFYRFVKRTYLAIAWIEKFLVNFFGIRLFWRWISNLWLHRIPDYIDRNADNIAYAVVAVVDAIIWVWTTWSRLWDYVMSWFNPWSYWKTRYYLSAYFRDKVWRRYTYYRLSISMAYEDNEFYISYYNALYFYGIALFFLNLKFFFSYCFIASNYAYYRFNYLAKFIVIFCYKMRQLGPRIWALSPFIMSLVFAVSLKSLQLVALPLKAIGRIFYNYNLSPSWRWIKLTKKGEQLGLGKKAGKWYQWSASANRPKP